ncbi:MAG: DUF5615 family PIN-like protein [Gammaproteobacteria bacterium]
MRLLADENFPGDAVNALRAAGHDVIWIRTDAPGSTDRSVLERATTETRVLLTFDKDFGELAWRFGLPSQCGIILFRLPMPLPREVGRAITNILTERSDWPGHFSVVEPGRIRMRPLPVRWQRGP